MGTSKDTSLKKSRAVNLLQKAIAEGKFDVPSIAEALVTDERTIGLYLAGSAPMPLDRQVCFARFLVERVPSLARHGHNLLGQLRAQMSYGGSDNVVHATPPMPNSRSY